MQDMKEKSKAPEGKAPAVSDPSTRATRSIPSISSKKKSVRALSRVKGTPMRANSSNALHVTVTENEKHPDDSSIGHLTKRGSLSRRAFVRVLDYGVTAEQGSRRTMEDQHVMLAEGFPFFGVYDGHGGTQCAEYLRENLHSLIFAHPNFKTNPEEAIRESIIKADSIFLQRSEQETNESGSVCAVALIIDDVLVVGNVGDCEAVLCRQGEPLVLTVKHSLQSNPSEVARVKEAGGKIFHNRVGHPKFNPSVVSLAVTRAIGDAGFKLDEYTDGRPSGVIAVPDTKSTKLTKEDEFLVIGCDGLWDVMSYAEVVEFCHRGLHAGEPAQHIAQELAQAALNKGSTDNVTAMLVQLNRRSGAENSGELYLEAAVSTSTRNLSEEP